MIYPIQQEFLNKLRISIHSTDERAKADAHEWCQKFVDEKQYEESQYWENLETEIVAHKEQPKQQL